MVGVGVLHTSRTFREITLSEQREVVKRGHVGTSTVGKRSSRRRMKRPGQRSPGINGTGQFYRN